MPYQYPRGYWWNLYWLITKYVPTSPYTRASDSEYFFAIFSLSASATIWRNLLLIASLLAYIFIGSEEDSTNGTHLRSLTIAGIISNHRLQLGTLSGFSRCEVLWYVFHTWVFYYSLNEVLVLHTLRMLSFASNMLQFISWRHSALNVHRLSKWQSFFIEADYIRSSTSRCPRGSTQWRPRQFTIMCAHKRALAEIQNHQYPNTTLTPIPKLICMTNHRACIGLHHSPAVLLNTHSIVLNTPRWEVVWENLADVHLGHVNEAQLVKYIPRRHSPSPASFTLQSGLHIL